MPTFLMLAWPVLQRFAVPVLIAFVAALTFGLVSVYLAKADVEDALSAANQKLSACTAEVASYNETVHKMQAQQLINTAKAAEVKTRVLTKVQALAAPIDNNRQALRERALHTAKEAAKLWNE